MKREEVIRLFPERIRKNLTAGVLESTGVTGDSSSGRETVDLMAGRTGIFCGRTGISDET